MNIIEASIRERGYAVITTSMHQEFVRTNFPSGCRAGKGTGKIGNYSFMLIKPGILGDRPPITEMKYCKSHGGAKAQENLTITEVRRVFGSVEAFRAVIDAAANVPLTTKKEAKERGTPQVTRKTTVAILLWPHPVKSKAKKQENWRKELLRCIREHAENKDNDPEWHRDQIRYHEERLRDLESSADSETTFHGTEHPDMDLSPPAPPRL